MSDATTPEERTPPTRQSLVTLREITRDTLDEILELKVRDDQTKFVASNAVSVAQASFDQEHAWFRAVYADETPVGFVMLYEEPTEAHYYLWRFMIDGRYQGKGFGRQALQLVIDYVRGRPNAKELLLSYFPADGSPQPFYASLGFHETEKQHGDEKEMKLVL